MATLREVSQVLMKLAAAIPHAPPLTEQHFRIFHAYLSDLDPALLELAADVLIIKAEFFPSVGKLRTAVVELLVQADGVPSAGDAWGEVVRSFATHGLYRGSPDWSHPLIGQAVQAIGGYARLCRSTNDAADRSQFRRAYESSLEKYREGIRTPSAIRDRVRLLERGGIDTGTAARDQELRDLDYEPLALAPPVNARIDSE